MFSAGLGGGPSARGERESFAACGRLTSVRHCRIHKPLSLARSLGMHADVQICIEGWCPACGSSNTTEGPKRVMMLNRIRGSRHALSFRELFQDRGASDVPVESSELLCRRPTNRNRFHERFHNKTMLARAVAILGTE